MVTQLDSEAVRARKLSRAGHFEETSSAQMSAFGDRPNVLTSHRHFAAIAITRGSSAFSIAMPSRGRKSNRADFSAAVSSRVLKLSVWVRATVRMMAIVGRTIVADLWIWPGISVPISTTA